MAKYRVRYVGGIERVVAEALKKETGTEGVLITSLELYSDMNPPKMAMVSRLVSTGDKPVILWIDGVGLAGDDSPGILELGLIKDPKVLMEKALQITRGVSDRRICRAKRNRGCSKGEKGNFSQKYFTAPK